MRFDATSFHGIVNIGERLLWHPSRSCLWFPRELCVTLFHLLSPLSFGFSFLLFSFFSLAPFHFNRIVLHRKSIASIHSFGSSCQLWVFVFQLTKPLPCHAFTPGPRLQPDIIKVPRTAKILGNCCCIRHVKDSMPPPSRYKNSLSCILSEFETTEVFVLRG